MNAVRRCGGIPILLLVLVAACAEPPNRELNQAQGAIDTARAAGADTYAPEEFEAATRALERARQAVGQRDYRLALDQALDARERAQNAARIAGDQKAVVRAEVDAALREATDLLEQARAAAAATKDARVPRARLQASVQAIEDAAAALREVRGLSERGEYLEARKRIAGVSAPLKKAYDDLRRAAAERAAPRGRRRGR